jgi:dihydrodipicolinate synthase/N-acetylneuraminate lyase
MGISERYPGVYAAMATPLSRDGEIDPTGVRNVVDYLFESGVTGLSILGSTGEGPALSIPQRQRALELSVEAAAGRGAVFTGAASTIVSEVIASLKTSAGSGAKGALVPPPFYYRLESDAIATYFERIAEASPVPIILYNIPVMTKLQIPPAAVARLAAHPNIMGLKDSGGDLSYFANLARLVADIPGFTLYTGSDELLAAALTVGAGTPLRCLPCLSGRRYRAGRGPGRTDRAGECGGESRHLPGRDQGAVFPQGALRSLCCGPDPRVDRCRNGGTPRATDRR